jgi:hypothetical protein
MANRVDLSGQQLKLAAAFLYEARRELDRIERGGTGARDDELRQQQREAMSYWMRAERHYRACHAAYHQGTTGNTG